MEPLVSIIIPCYNQAQYLTEAVASVLEQTFDNWECIIVDDGSTDESEKVAMLLAQKDERISFYTIENGGPSRARNAGISKAKGKYILPLDGDDKISDNYVEECLKLLEADQRITVVYGAGEKFGAVNERIKRADYDWNTLLFGNMIHVSGMYRKTDWENVGGYDEQMRGGLEDWEFWINILKPGKNVVQLKNINFYQRVNSVSRTAKLHEQGIENKLRQYVYFKHATLYDHLFEDPLKAYKESIYYKDLWNWALKNPFKFFWSRVKNKE